MPAVPPMPRVRCGWRGSTPPIGIRQFSSSCTCRMPNQTLRDHLPGVVPTQACLQEFWLHLATWQPDIPTRQHACTASTVTASTVQECLPSMPRDLASSRAAPS